MERSIYLDNHATTPLDPRVFEAMTPFFLERFANPASGHALGQQAANAVDRARTQVGALIGADPDEIVFTCGATEADNLAILGTLSQAGGGHVVTTAVEHRAVLEVCRQLRRVRSRATVLPVDGQGQVDREALGQALRPDTVLLSVMAANNEVGTLQPVGEIGRLSRARGILMHTDAAQAAGRIPVDVGELGVDLLSLSGHKMYGPKGIGALYVRRAVRGRIAPISWGGGQEGGLRPGTVNVPAIVGLGEACRLAREEMTKEAVRLRVLAERFLARLRQLVPGLTLNGHPSQRLPGNLHLSFPYVKAEPLLLAVERLALSTGSACSSGGGPSHVLQAMGLSDERIAGSVRIGLGRFNTVAEVDEAVSLLGAAVQRLQQLSPRYLAAQQAAAGDLLST